MGRGVGHQLGAGWLWREVEAAGRARRLQERRPRTQGNRGRQRGPQTPTRAGLRHQGDSSRRRHRDAPRTRACSRRGCLAEHPAPGQQPNQARRRGTLGSQHPRGGSSRCPPPTAGTSLPATLQQPQVRRLPEARDQVGVRAPRNQHSSARGRGVPASPSLFINRKGVSFFSLHFFVTHCCNSGHRREGHPERGQFPKHQHSLGSIPTQGTNQKTKQKQPPNTENSVTSNS